MKTLPPDTAIIVIDHGSKREAANNLLFEMIAQFKNVTGLELVEGAHMELAQPTLAEAVEACIKGGARKIVVHPYFLAPGRHSTGDIPAMVQEMATAHPAIQFRVTEPLGVAPELAAVMHQRIQEALNSE